MLRVPPMYSKTLKKKKLFEQYKCSLLFFFLYKDHIGVCGFHGEKYKLMNEIYPMVGDLPCANHNPLQNPPILQVPTLHPCNDKKKKIMQFF